MEGSSGEFEKAPLLPSSLAGLSVSGLRIRLLRAMSAELIAAVRESIDALDLRAAEVECEAPVIVTAGANNRLFNERFC